MEFYRTVRGFAESRFTEKKSEFIGRVKPCGTWEEAKDFVSEARRLDPDARHHVSAFINREGNVQRFDDDGEPKGTGGIPMLEVLKKEELTGVCVVVTRYFGGILLGAGGLARAYARGARDAVEAAGICRFSKVFVAKASIPYALFPKAEFEIGVRSFRVTGKEFGEEVTLSFLVSESERESLSALLGDLSGGRIRVETVGETFAEDRNEA
ncbi:MAG: YigZ family protein [Clostridia bacterium]|nr:YigZ family protein [Clostridia bacterium]